MTKGAKLEKDRKQPYQKPEVVEYENLDEITRGADPSQLAD